MQKNEFPSFKTIDDQARPAPPPAKKTAKEKKGVSVSIRWHDAGDFFSDPYLKLAYDVAKTFPDVQFYAYTKMASVAASEKPNNFIINFKVSNYIIQN